MRDPSAVHGAGALPSGARVPSRPMDGRIGVARAFERDCQRLEVRAADDRCAQGEEALARGDPVAEARREHGLPPVLDSSRLSVGPEVLLPPQKKSSTCAAPAPRSGRASLASSPLPADRLFEREVAFPHRRATPRGRRRPGPSACDPPSCPWRTSQQLSQAPRRPSTSRGRGLGAPFAGATSVPRATGISSPRMPARGGSIADFS